MPKIKRGNNGKLCLHATTGNLHGCCPECGTVPLPVPCIVFSWTGVGGIADGSITMPMADLYGPSYVASVVYSNPTRPYYLYGVSWQCGMIPNPSGSGLIPRQGWHASIQYQYTSGGYTNTINYFGYGYNSGLSALTYDGKSFAEGNGLAMPNCMSSGAGTALLTFCEEYP
jgi:hypothetical protein